MKNNFQEGYADFAAPSFVEETKETSSPLSVLELLIDLLKLLQISSVSAIALVIARVWPQAAPLCLVSGLLALLGLAGFAIAQKGDQSKLVALIAIALVVGACGRSWDAIPRIAQGIQAGSWHQSGLLVVAIVLGLAIAGDRLLAKKKADKRESQHDHPLY